MPPEPLNLSPRTSIAPFETDVEDGDVIDEISHGDDFVNIRSPMKDGGITKKRSRTGLTKRCIEPRLLNRLLMANGSLGVNPAPSAKAALQSVMLSRCLKKQLSMVLKTMYYCPN
jgi:hypothetical protein